MREYLTEQHKQRISEAHKGLSIRPEVREKISAKMTGRKLSDDTKRKMSEARKGRTLTAEHKQKLSEAMKRFNRLNQRGRQEMEPYGFGAYTNIIQCYIDDSESAKAYLGKVFA